MGNTHSISEWLKRNIDGRMDKANMDNVITKEMISSSHISFLFGAGVNGKAFPQLNSFEETEEKIRAVGGDTSKGIESGIDSLNSMAARETIKQTFIAELKAYSREIDYGNDSIKHLESMLRKIHNIVNESQNRNPSMKQVNIYTLNYDTIVERTLDNLGFFSNYISSSSVGVASKMLDVIGYNYKTRKYAPSFMISKLHGDLEAPIIPGKEKYREVLTPDYFEIAFNMKGQLCRNNSILIVIGYSGRDGHINQILQDCINAGLTVIWYRYNSEDELPKVFQDSNQIIIRDQSDDEEKVDTTKLCFDDLESAWGEK